MIVLDENISRQSVLERLNWYAGKVVPVRSLHPDTVIKDDATPSLLQHQKHPTFVTTDVDGFWRKVCPHPNFCIVCFPLPDHKLHLLPMLIRRLFRTKGFRTKRERMGKVVLVTGRTVHFYGVNQPSVVTVPLAD